MTQHLFVTLDYPPNHGGVARYYEHLVNAFPHGSVVVLTPPTDDATDRPERVSVVRKPFFSKKGWPRWLPLVRLLSTALRTERPSYLHIGQVVPVGTAAFIANRRFHVPTIVYTHGMDLQFAAKNPWRRWMASRVLRSATWVVANSQFTADLVRRFGVPAERILLVLPGVTFWPATCEEKRKNELQTILGKGSSFMLLSVARLVERKGIDIVLNAIAHLIKTLPLTYCIVGEGPERVRLEARAASLGIAQNVRFFGGADDETLKALYALCDAFILVPKAAQSGRDVEGFGMVYLEANAFGKPVIGADTGGVRDAIIANTTGLLVPPEDIDAVIHAIRQLAESPTLCQRLGESGRKHVAEQCLWVQRVVPLFTRLQTP